MTFNTPKTIYFDPQLEIRKLWVNLAEGMDLNEIAYFVLPDVFKLNQGDN